MTDSDLVADIQAAKEAIPCPRCNGHRITVIKNRLTGGFRLQCFDCQYFAFGGWTRTDAIAIWNLGLVEFRGDGWPFCPRCGEDELYSLLNWNGQGARPELSAWIQAGLRCYKCRLELVGADASNR